MAEPIVTPFDYKLFWIAMGAGYVAVSSLVTAGVLYFAVARPIIRAIQDSESK